MIRKYVGKALQIGVALVSVMKIHSRSLVGWLLFLVLFGCSAKSSNSQEDKAPSAARDNSEVAHALNRRCYPHTGNGGHSWCLSSSLSLSVGFSIQDETMDAARSAPGEAHYLTDVIFVFLKLGLKISILSKVYANSVPDQLSVHPV